MADREEGLTRFQAKWNHLASPKSRKQGECGLNPGLNQTGCFPSRFVRGRLKRGGFADRRPERNLPVGYSLAATSTGRARTIPELR
jgi:hypothetical protein